MFSARLSRFITVALYVAIAAPSFSQEWSPLVALNPKQSDDPSVEKVCSVASEPSGNVMVAWIRSTATDGAKGVAVARSVNGGRFFEPYRLVNTSVSTNTVAVHDVDLVYVGAERWICTWCETNWIYPSLHALVMQSRSIDNGKTWEKPARITMQDSSINNVAIESDGRGTVILLAGRNIFHSADFGQTWRYVYTYYTGRDRDIEHPLLSCKYMDNGRWLLAGADSFRQDYILETVYMTNFRESNDNGYTWDYSDLSDSGNFGDMVVQGGAIAVAYTMGITAITPNGGEIWQQGYIWGGPKPIYWEKDNSGTVAIDYHNGQYHVVAKEPETNRIVTCQSADAVTWSAVTPIIPEITHAKIELTRLKSGGLFFAVSGTLEGKGVDTVYYSLYDVPSLPAAAADWNLFQ